jgi:HK97 family phage major capsid protein
MDRMEVLAQQAAQIDGEIRSIQAAVAAENRTSTPEELAKVTELNQRFDLVNTEREQLEQTLAREAKIAKPQPRVTQAAPNTNTTAPSASGSMTITGGGQVAHNYANHGFAKGVGEFLVAVRNVYQRGHADPRLMVNAVTTFGGESVGGDGGYALPPQFAAGILEAVSGEGTFINALRPFVTSSNLLVVPTDETAPWSTTGITGAAYSEGASITATKLAIKQVNVQLHKAAALVHVSDENLQDVSFLSSYVMRKMGSKLRYIAEDWVINGDGNGSPLGFANGPGLVTVAKKSDQTRATTPIVPENLAKMVSSLFGESTSRYVWVCNPTVLPSVWTMATASTGYPLYLPDFKQAPGGLILGRPVYTSEACAIAGTAGDIYAVDADGYILATKAEQIATATTIAFAFDQGIQSFRATMRLGGAPVLQSKIARAKSGSSYIGHIVNLGV